MPFIQIPPEKHFLPTIGGLAINPELQKKWLFSLVRLGAVVGVCLFCIYFLLPRLLPFLLGFSLAVLIHPAALWLEGHSPLRPRAAALAVTLSVYVLLGGLLWAVGSLLFLQGTGLVRRLPTLWEDTLLPISQNAGEQMSNFMNRFSPEISTHFSDMTDQISLMVAESLRSVSSDVLMWLGSLVSHLPIFTLTVIFTLMISLLISLDYKRVMSFVIRQLPQKAGQVLLRGRVILVGSALRMLRAYALLSLITWIEVGIGLRLLGVQNALFIALLVAVVDLLPVLGSGIVLVSWGAVMVASGNLPMGAGLFLLWGVVGLVRSILEPKIVGDNIGLHPIITITAMYFGLQTFGVVGMLSLPLVCLVALRLHKEGILKVYR